MSSSTLLLLDDEVSPSSSRLSSCSLDSVIGYLDQLLGRSPSLSTAVKTNVPGPADEEPQRVMDLSFASVYEVPSSCSSSASDVTTELVDSGVESNKSDADDSIQFHDYQNLVRHKAPGAVTAGSSRRRHRAKVAAAAATAATAPPPPHAPSASKADDKFYEICLGHLCHRMDAGPNGWISIFSLQKHQDELLELSSGNQSQQQHPQHRQPPQRQQSSTSGGGPIHRQPSLSHESEPPGSSRNNGKFHGFSSSIHFPSISFLVLSFALSSASCSQQ